MSNHRLPFTPVVALLAVIWLGGCGSSPRPSPAGLTLEVPSPVTGRYLTCTTCATALSVVAEFTVRLGDPAGPGGTLETLTVTAVDRSRDTTLAQNTRPNADYAFPDTSVPSGGSLALAAGIVIAPAPPPRDAVEVTVRAALTDGRQVVARAPLVVSAE